MMEDWKKRAAIDTAIMEIQSRRSRGQVKRALITQFGLMPNEAGRLIRTAVRELYDCDSRDPIFWLMQDCGESTPLQRRFAHKKRRTLMQDPAISRSVELLSSSRAWN